MAQLGAYNFIDMRSSAGYVTDDLADNYSTGETTARTLPGALGLTYLWNAPGGASGTNVNASLDTRLAGFISNSGISQFVVSGFTPGVRYRLKGAWSYNDDATVGFAMYQGADAGGAVVQNVRSTPTNIDYGGTVLSSQIRDATGALVSFSAWLTAEGGDYAEFIPTGSSVCFFRSTGYATQHVRAIGFASASDPAPGKTNALTTRFYGR